MIHFWTDPKVLMRKHVFFKNPDNVHQTNSNWNDLVLISNAYVKTKKKIVVGNFEQVVCFDALCCLVEMP